MDRPRPLGGRGDRRHRSRSHLAWQMGVHRQPRLHGIIDGDWGYFMRQHEDRGIIALVEFTSPIYPDEHWSGVAGAMANYADFEVVDWLKPADRLPVEVLEQKVPEVGWDRLQGSGVKVFERSTG